MLAVLAALCYCFWVRMQTVRDYLTRDKIAKEVTELYLHHKQGACGLRWTHMSRPHIALPSRSGLKQSVLRVDTAAGLLGKEGA